MDKATLEVTRVYSRSGVTMGTRLSLQSSGYGCDNTMVLVEALKQLRADGPKRTSRVMIDIEPAAGLGALLDRVMSMPPRVRESTTVVITMGREGISDEACRTLRELRKRSGVGLGVLVESASWGGCLGALEKIDAETVILGRSMVLGHLDGGCSMQLLDISELCEKKGTRAVAQGDFTEAQMARMAEAGITAFLGRRFEASIHIASLENCGCKGLVNGRIRQDRPFEELMMRLGCESVTQN